MYIVKSYYVVRTYAHNVFCVCTVHTYIPYSPQFWQGEIYWFFKCLTEKWTDDHCYHHAPVARCCNYAFKILDGKICEWLTGNYQKRQDFSLSKFFAIQYIISGILFLFICIMYDLHVNLVSHNLLYCQSCVYIRTPWE